MNNETKDHDNNNKKRYRQSETISGTKINKLANVWLTAIILPTLIYYCYNRIYHSERKRADLALQEVFDHAEIFFLAESKLLNLTLEAKQFQDSMLNSQVKFIMDEIGNIRRQTEIYENMNQSPSGIKNFMETATATLDKLLEDLSSYIQQHSLTTETVKTFLKVTESHIQEYENEVFIKYLKDAEVSLNSFKIYLFPKHLEDPFSENSTELPFIIKTMKNELFPILQEFESTIANANSDTPLCGTVDDCVKKLEHILGKIRNVAKIHEHQFRKVGKLLILKLHEIRALIVELKIMNNAKILVEKLMKGIEEDTVSLKERINNLQNPNRDEF